MPVAVADVRLHRFGHLGLASTSRQDPTSARSARGKPRPLSPKQIGSHAFSEHSARPAADFEPPYLRKSARWSTIFKGVVVGRHFVFLWGEC